MICNVFTVLGIALISGAVYGLVWLFHDTHRATLTCECGNKRLRVCCINEHEASGIREQLTALCLSCRCGKIGATP